MPKGVYKRTQKHLKQLKKHMLDIRTTKFGFQKGHKLNNGEKSALWKGEKAGNSAHHKWIRKHKPVPKRCERCGLKRKLQASNTDHKYRRNIKDWEYICAKCHVYKDGTINNLKQNH